MSQRVMIMSQRSGGYRKGGIHYGRVPVAYEVVPDVPSESDDQALKRRHERKLTQREVDGMRAQSDRDEAAGQTPSLSVIDSVSEGASVEREIDEKRARAAALDERTREAERKLGEVKAEIDATRSTATTLATELAALRDQHDVVERTLKAAEAEHGALLAAQGELKAAKSLNRKLERKLEQAAK